MALQGFSTASKMALGACVALAAASIAFPVDFNVMMQSLADGFRRHAGGGVLITSSMLVILCCFLMVHPVGRRRLGGEGARPEFSTLSWIAMLFAAGMGAGLLFWGVAEPILHYRQSPFISDKANQAIAITYLHWALHPWAIYAMGALVLAYFSFEKATPMLPSAPFMRWMPHQGCRMIDALCLLSMMVGMAASLAQGAVQLHAGLHMVIGDSLSMTTLSGLIIGALFIVYSVSVATSLDRGIRLLSLLTIVLAMGLLVFFLVMGHAGMALRYLEQATLDYVQLLPLASFTRLEVSGAPNWSNDWTITYFLSWIAWVPFVGVFVARTSYGRTIRQFLLGVMVVPSLFSMLWFAVLGGTAFATLEASRQLLDDVVQQNASDALFALLSYYPYAEGMLYLVLLLVFAFLVTSADSASYVMAMLAEHGNTDPDVPMRLLWGAILAVLTFGLVLGGDGIESVRAVVSVGAIAIYIILIVQVALLLIDLLGHNKKRG